MRTIYIIIIILAEFHLSYSQTIYPLNTEPELIQDESFYLKDTESDYDALVGTWAGISGSQTFEITLQKFTHVEFPSGSSQYYDWIFGKYRLLENGTSVIEVSSIPNVNISLPKIALVYISPASYHFQILDVSSNRTKVGILTLVNPNTIHIEVHDLINTSGVMNPNNPVNGAFQLPVNITLTKI